MSWDAYVSQSLMCPLDSEGRTLTAAAILGLDGGVWAASENFPAITPEEVTTFLTGFDERSPLASFTLAGEKYMKLQGDDTVLRGRKGPGGVTIAKTNTALVVGIYNEPIQPGACNKVVEAMGDYLTGQGY